MTVRCSFLLVLAVLLGTALLANASALPAAGHREQLAEAISPTAPRALSPIDTLHLSRLERIFWGRHGLMRTTGIFPLDQQNPRNDFRQIARVRRKMLSFHQMLGLATVASMAVTVYGGQRAIDGHSSSLHKASLPFTIGLYSTTAILALASPPKLIPSRGGVDTITFHKYFAAVHLAGMVITPLIAPDGTSSSRRRHQIAGYTTFGAFTGGMVVVTFFK